MYGGQSRWDDMHPTSSLMLLLLEFGETVGLERRTLLGGGVEQGKREVEMWHQRDACMERGKWAQ